MSNPILCADNILQRAAKIVNVSGFAPDHPPSHAWRGVQTAFWRHDVSGQAVLDLDIMANEPVDYWAIRGLFDSAQLQYSTDGVNYINIGAPVAGDKLLLAVFAEITARYWRWVISRASAAVQVQLLYAGKFLQVPVGMKPGWQPHALANTDQAASYLSQQGQFLGASKRTMPPRSRCDFDYVDAAWVENQFNPFLDQYRNQAMIFSWDYENRPEHAIYGWITSRDIKPAYRAAGTNLMRVSFDLMGAR